MSGTKFIFATQTTDVRSTDVEGLGRLRWEDDKCFRWICNPVTNYTPASGDVVCHTFTDGATALQNISKPATATLGLMAGVVCSSNLAASTGTNPTTFGWIQVYGPCALPIVTTTSAAAGNALIAVNGQTYLTSGAAMGTAPIYTKRCILMDTTGNAVAANVLVQCL